MPAKSDPLGTESQTLTLSAGSIAVWDKGGLGVPLILVHGNSSSKEAFRALIESAVLANRRMIAFDFPGCGESSDAENWKEIYTLPGLAGVLIDVVRALELNDHITVGWSMGGHVAIEALRYGLSPRGLVLTGTPPCGPSQEEIAATFLPIDGSEVMSALDPSLELLTRYAYSVYKPTPPSDVLMRDARRADGRLRHRLFEHLAANQGSQPQRATVAAWPGPIAVIQGDKEPFFEPKTLNKLQWGNLWRGETQWISGAGHAPFHDQPDHYAALLEAFARDV